MDRAIAAGALQAVAFCHSHAVAHGSLGSGSLLLSHLDDRRPEQLLVKLDNFGYAYRMDAPEGNCTCPMHVVATQHA
jgi:serine/threonine protein kinase